MKLTYWAGMFLLYGVFLLGSAPSSLLFWAAGKYAGPYEVATESSSGTLWHGEARNIVLSTKGRQALKIDQASWSLHPLQLLSGKLSADIVVAGSSMRGHGNIALGKQSLGLRQVDFAIPAVLLSSVVPQLAMWPLEGVLSIRADEFSLQPDHYQGKGEVAWEQAGISLSKLKPLGSYRAAFSGTGNTVRFQLETRTGPLELVGEGSWSQPDRLAFSGSAKALERETELRDLLGLIGKPDRNGVYPLKL